MYVGHYNELGHRAWGRRLNFNDGVLQESLRWRSIVKSDWIDAYTPEGKAKGLAKGPGKGKSESQSPGEAESQSPGKGKGKGKGNKKGKGTHHGYGGYRSRVWRQIVRESFPPFRRCEDSPSSCCRRFSSRFSHDCPTRWANFRAHGS